METEWGKKKHNQNYLTLRTEIYGDIFAFLSPLSSSNSENY